MVNEEHIQWLLEGVDAWNAKRKSIDFKPDLSNVDVYQRFGDAGKLEPTESYDPEGRIPLNNADFTDVDFTGTILASANLANANLVRANLTGASLIDADLTNAKLASAILTDTDFASAHFSKTNLARTDLSHADLIWTDIWRANLFDNTSTEQPMDLGQTVVTSIGCLLDIIQKIKKHHDVNTLFYFRGEYENQWKLRPSLMRPLKQRSSNLASNESEMLRNLISRRPEEFSRVTSALDQWVLAQHHGLNTRFLDVMKNPLVGCFSLLMTVEKKKPSKETSEHNNEERTPPDGRLHVFAVPRSLVKPYSSDTVSVIAKLC